MYIPHNIKSYMYTTEFCSAQHNFKFCHCAILSFVMSVSNNHLFSLHFDHSNADQ